MNDEPKSGTKEDKEETKDAIFKNVGFVDQKWTEILVEDEKECEELEREEVKKAIIKLSKRELPNRRVGRQVYQSQTQNVYAGRV